MCPNGSSAYRTRDVVLVSGCGGVLPQQEVSFHASGGPEACPAQGHSQRQPLKPIEAWTRFLLAFASSLFSLDATVKAGGSKSQQGC